MSKFLHCGRWNKNYKFILLTAIFAFFTNYIFGYTFNDYLDEIKIYNRTNDTDKVNATGNHTNNNNNNNHVIINYFFRYLGLILFSFILYKIDFFYKNKIFKDNSEYNIFKSSSIKLIYNNFEENIKNKIIISPLFILLIMIIMALQEISEDIFYKSNLRALDFWMFELPLLSYFNLKYFKFKIYRHHKLVIYLNIIICGILRIIYLIVVINDDEDRKKNSIFEYYSKNLGIIPFGIITYLMIMISRAFALSEIKVLMQYKYLSPIKLLIIYGIIGAIITIIIGIISSFIECNKIISFSVLKICRIKDNKYESYFFENFRIWWNDEFNISGIFLLLTGIIMNFFYRLFYILIIKNLTAIHIIFSNLFYTNLLGSIRYIKILINSEDNNNINLINIFILFIHIIIFIGLLIYLEMIELNFCKLNYNLKKTIIERSMQDYELEIDNEEDEIND